MLVPKMTDAIDHTSETFRRRFHPHAFENVCVLAFPEHFTPDDSEALSLFRAGVESLVRAGVGGFVFDVNEFSRRADLREALEHVIGCMQPVLMSRRRINWLHGSPLIEEWKRSTIFSPPPDNFETEREAVGEMQTVLKAARVRIDLAQRIVNSGVSIRQIANLAGLFEGDVRRIAEGLEQPSDAVALLISSTLDALSTQKTSTE